MGLNGIITILYIILCILVTIWAAKRTSKRKTARSYLAANGSLGWLLVAFSTFGSTVGGTQFVGFVSSYMNIGLSIAWYSTTRVIAYILMGWIICPKVYRLKTMVCNDYFGKVFQPCDDLLYAIFQSIVLLGLAASQIMVGALLIPSIFPTLTNLTLNMIITAIIFGVLTVAGGQLSVSATNAMHTCMIIICIVITLILGFSRAGGFANVIAALPDDPIYTKDFISGAGVWTVIGWFFGMVIQPWAGQVEWNATASANGPRGARKAFIVNGIAQLALCACVCFIGMLAKTQLPADVVPSQAFATLATDLSPFFGAVAVVGVFAATASTGQGMFVAEASVTLSLITKYSKKDIPQNRQFYISMISTACYCVISFFFALLAYDIVKFIINVMAVMTPFSLILVLSFYCPQVLRKSHVTVTAIICLPVAIIFFLSPAMQAMFASAAIYPLMIATLVAFILCWIFDKRHIDPSFMFRTDEEVAADNAAESVNA